MTHLRTTQFFAAVAVAAFALPGTPPVQAQTQAQMNQTAAKNEAKADVAMNAAYKKLMIVLNVSQKLHLRHSQRAWLVYRDGEAALVASASEGGTMYPTLYSSAIEKLTEDRTRELKRDYEELKP